MSNEVVELGALETITPFQRMDENQAAPHVSERVVINVSGLRFETQLSTIERFSTTLLGCKEKRNRYFDPLKNEYFFDRNRPSFDAILYYYQNGGRLRRPVNVPTDVFTEEIKFYEIDERVIQQYLEDEDCTNEQPHQMPSSELKKKIWLLFEFPESSRPAFILALISLLIIFLSISVFCIETLPSLQTFAEKENFSNRSYITLFIIESCCIAWFTVELLIRFLVCPNRLKFVKSIMNIIDLLVIQSFVINVSLFFFGVNNLVFGRVLAVLIITLRVARVLRICKLFPRSKGLQMLGRTIKASIPELCMLMVFFTMLVVIFSSSIYYAEMNADSYPFRSIPDAFWWAVVTLTTVGYGDMLPVTVCGKFVGSLCAIAGILVIVLPIPLVMSKLNYFYNREVDSGQRKRIFY